MDVMILVNDLGGGGAERFVLNLLGTDAFKARNLDYSLVLCGSRVDYEINKEVSGHVSTLKANRTVFSIFSLLRLIRQRRPKNIFVVSFRVTQLLLLFRKFIPSQCRLILSIPCILSMRQNTWIEHCLDKFLMKSACLDQIKIICKSNYMKQDLLKYVGLDQARSITIINNPCIDWLHGGALSVPPASDTIKLLFVGRLHFVKGLDRLFYALAHVKRRWSLTILGKGAEEEALIELAEKLGIRASVNFMGFCTELKNAYMQHDALMMPSRTEGFPNVLIEANMLGCPIIAFDSPGGVAEALRWDPRRGVLVSDGDILAMASAIEKFSPTSYNRKMIRELALQDFCSRDIPERYLSLMSERD